MQILPYHVICVLGRWRDFNKVKEVVAAWGNGFEFDDEYSELTPDDRMTRAFEASIDRFRPTMTDEDWDAVASHTAVAYILSPPMSQSAAEKTSGYALLLIAQLLERGGLAAKSESAGLAHGRAEWLQLAHRYSTALDHFDAHGAGASLYWAWVQRLLHDPSTESFYSIGMHLLGHRDTEIEDTIELATALDWIDLMGLYLVADKPDRPVKDGEGFRLHDDGPRRIIQHEPCERYDDDEFFFNPYGYHFLAEDS